MKQESLEKYVIVSESIFNIIWLLEAKPMFHWRSCGWENNKPSRWISGDSPRAGWYPPNIQQRNMSFAICIFFQMQRVDRILNEETEIDHKVQNMCNSLTLIVIVIVIRGDVKKSGNFGWCAPQTTAWSKNYHFMFLLPLNPEPSKTCKNSQKNLNYFVLPLSRSCQR